MRAVHRPEEESDNQAGPATMRAVHRPEEESDNQAGPATMGAVHRPEEESDNQAQCSRRRSARRFVRGRRVAPAGGGMWRPPAGNLVDLG
jgi:hypothetical protein